MNEQIIKESFSYLKKKNPNVNELSQINILNLMFLAEKYHVLKYGRLISEDNYNISYFGIIGEIGKRVYNNENVDINNLSDTDIEALDFVLKYFSNINDLKTEIYTFPEWKRYSEIMNEDLKKEYPLVLEDLFKIEQDPFFIIDQKIVILSRE